MAVTLVTNASATFGSDEPKVSVKRAVDGVVAPLMEKDGIPGMAVGIAFAGETYEFEFGVASKSPARPVTRKTLFEVGSISKTFTATLASWAQVTGKLSLADDTATYLPSLRGTDFGKVTLLELGTHTPGGMPLQVPDGVNNDEQLLSYLAQWHPAYAPGTMRTYNNPGIGTLGLITAKSSGQRFDTLMERQLFPMLGLKNTFINVPSGKMADYAEGYRDDGTPIRMAPGELWAEAYGVRTTVSDLLRFLQANMGEIPLEPSLQRAIAQTHTGYFQAGPMTQDLIWEQYPYPVALATLRKGNSPEMILTATPVSRLKPPLPPRADVWINKTGSTNGFGAYVAFVPSKRVGIVILANRNYSIKDRVTAAYEIADALTAP
ncbi:MAG TPA: class C beta-lactamase [Candidatus Nitrosotalea sp.]|nr:class C beta-lactamase [Candidatus Nitrosotalea sp.]